MTGYGHVTPKTAAGKVVTVLYAVVGIPIVLMFMSNIGNVLAKIFIAIFSYICRCRFLNAEDPLDDDPVIQSYRRTASRVDKLSSTDSSGNPTTDEPNPTAVQSWEPEVAELVRRVERKDNNVPVVGCLLIMSAYLFGGATLFALWEGWPYLDAFYFCFVTLTTIGFGDFVPGASMLSADTSNQKLVMCCIYVLVGLALIACCFNLMQHQVRKYIEALARVMGLIKARTLGVTDFTSKRTTSIPTTSIDDV